jgi:hypothetical protein
VRKIKPPIHVSPACFTEGSGPFLQVRDQEHQEEVCRGVSRQQSGGLVEDPRSGVCGEQHPASGARATGHRPRVSKEVL